MSQTKVQLIQPVGIVTAPGVNVSGTLTATTFDGNLTGDASSLVGSPNLNVGFITATSFSGNGENLTGVAGSTFIGVVTAAQSGTTTIDLSLGNIIYFTQDTNTTVAFANTESTQVLDFIRAKDDTTDARTITWPDSIIWDGGSAPTLIDSSDANDVQIFKLITRDQGVTWYGYEAMKNDPVVPPTGNLFMWGRIAASGGQLAQNDNVQRSSPVQVPGSWTNNISYDEFSIYVLKGDNTFWTWGYNYGDLGQNSTVSYSSPIQVPGSWSSVSKIAGSGFAIKTDGTLWAIGGLNTHGQLGINDRVARSSPIQLPGTQWSQVGGGDKVTFGLKTDGTLWSWGYNRDGQLGINDTIRRSSPTQVPGTSWSYVASHTGLTFAALKTDGSLWRSGYNLYGGCSTNDTVEYSSPRQIPGTWSKVKCGGSNWFAGIKTDGTLWVSGNNSSNGNLAQPDNAPRSSPIQIPGTQWNEIGGAPGLASKTDGTLWSWGQNNFGSQGVNDTIYRSSPVQIPGTQWNGALDGNYTFAAIQDYS